MNTASPADDSLGQQFARLLSQPVDIASLAAFRVLFGLVLAWHFSGDWLSGRAELAYLVPRYLFKYPGFGWVEPLPAGGMQALYWALTALSLAVACGALYRVSMVLLFCGHTYTFLLDVARYQNHLYLTSLICFLLIFAPAHRAFSLDNLLWRRAPQRLVPAWPLWALQFQLGVVYFFGGVAKLNADWLLRAQPLRLWLAERPPRVWREDWMAEPWFAYFLSWGGLVFDLFLVPFLLWRRTRTAAVLVAVGFHLANHQLFNIGYFPVFMIASMPLFLRPDWPRRLFTLFRSAKEPHPGDPPAPVGRLLCWSLYLYAMLQLLVPLRHLAYPGPVAWTEEGHRFSWRMKLRDKRGELRYEWHDAARGQARPLHLGRVLTPFQQRKLRYDPYLIAQFARSVGKEFGELQGPGGGPFDLRVRSQISLNGHPPQPLIEPYWNLAATELRFLRPAPWIRPLHTANGTQGNAQQP